MVNEYISMEKSSPMKKAREIRFYPLILRITWTKHVRNEEVLRGKRITRKINQKQTDGILGTHDEERMPGEVNTHRVY